MSSRSVTNCARRHNFASTIASIRCANAKDHHCLCLCARVEAKGANTLENLLARAAPGIEVDLLSIDIDGDDYFVLESLEKLAPRVIVCEYNPTIPPQLELVPAPGNYFGCSALALVRLAERRGYRLVAVTDTNCFFVRASDFDDRRRIRASFETRGDDETRRAHARGVGGRRRVAGHRLAR